MRSQHYLKGWVCVRKAGENHVSQVWAARISEALIAALRSW